MVARIHSNRRRESGPDRLMRRTGHNRVEFCPNCGAPLKAFRRGFIKLCRAMKVTPKLPPEHECMRCGLDIRRVRIAG
jgi:rRNA maturation endonuclease Nob1